jgi:Holliday junction resolvase RusA-like endonuclease
MGAPRQTRADTWKKRPVVLKYRAFRDFVRGHFEELETLGQPFAMQDGAHITFYVTMANSWSHKKREEMDGQVHRQKPDIDNMLKALLDSMFIEDAHVGYIGSVKKVWCDRQVGYIRIENP